MINSKEALKDLSDFLEENHDTMTLDQMTLMGQLSLLRQILDELGEIKQLLAREVGGREVDRIHKTP